MIKNLAKNHTRDEDDEEEHTVTISTVAPPLAINLIGKIAKRIGATFHSEMHTRTVTDVDGKVIEKSTLNIIGGGVLNGVLSTGLMVERTEKFNIQGETVSKTTRNMDFVALANEYMDIREPYGENILGQQGNKTTRSALHEIIGRWNLNETLPTLNPSATLETTTSQNPEQPPASWTQRFGANYRDFEDRSTTPENSQRYDGYTGGILGGERGRGPYPAPHFYDLGIS